jgi:hypothetical protein
MQPDGQSDRPGSDHGVFHLGCGAMVSWYWSFAIKMQTKCFETFTGIALIYGSRHGSRHGSQGGLLNAEGGNAPA